MAFSRSERRHHRSRLIVKRRKEDSRYGVGYALNESEWRFVNCRVRARTACLCSCPMCGNPRKFYGNSVKGKTFAELRSDYNLRERE